jgi:hypothetical protein
MTSIQTESTDAKEPQCWSADAAIAAALGSPRVVIAPDPEPAKPRTPEQSLAETIEWQQLQEARKRELQAAELVFVEAEREVLKLKLRHAVEDLGRTEAYLGPHLDEMRRTHREPDTSLFRLRQFADFPGGLASQLHELGPLESELAHCAHRARGLRRTLGLPDEAENTETPNA